MSSERAWTFRLSHALRAIEKILRYTADLSEESFRLDEKTIDAVIRNFQVMGEAIRHVPSEFRKSHPALPWSSMEKMRHVLVHDYDKVDVSILWHTIQQDLPPLVDPLRALRNVSTTLRHRRVEFSEPSLHPWREAPPGAGGSPPRSLGSVRSAPPHHHPLLQASVD